MGLNLQTKIDIPELINKFKTLGVGALFSQKSTKIPEGGLGICFTDTSIIVSHIDSKKDKKTEVKQLVSVDALGWDERRTALRSIVEEYGLQEQYCHIVLVKEQYKLTIIEKPAAAEDEIGEAIANAMQDYLDYSLEEASLASCELPFVRSSDGKKQVCVVSMRNEIMFNIEQCLSHCKLNLISIDIPEFAYRNLFSLDSEIKGSYLALILHYNGGELYLYNGNNLLLSRKVVVDLYKYSVGVSIEMNDDTQFPELDKLSSDVSKSIDYVNSLFREHPIEKMVLLPSSINSELIGKYLSKHVSVPYHVYNLEETIKIDEKLDYKNYYTAIGAALRTTLILGEKKNAVD